MILDPIQILLISVISVLTLLTVIIGLEFFIILKEIKKSLEKINKILDDSVRISGAVAKPIEEASDFLVGLKKGFHFFDSISKFFKELDFLKKPKKPALKEVGVENEKNDHEVLDEEIIEEEKPVLPKKAKKNLSKFKKRFFFKSGKKLGK